MREIGKSFNVSHSTDFATHGMTTTYVAALLRAYPSIKEVWLIGSRADGSAKPTSDWDYIILANQGVLAALSKTSTFNQPDIDLLVVFDGDNFRKPWADGQREKRGSLSGWEWRAISATAATYRATKAGEGEDFNVDVRIGRAIRVHPT
jgi:Nucleotidyltransferase domain